MHIFLFKNMFEGILKNIVQNKSSSILKKFVHVSFYSFPAIDGIFYHFMRQHFPAIDRIFQLSVFFIVICWGGALLRN